MTTTPTQRNSRGLRDALFDEIDAFRRGEGDPERAIAISKLASQVIASAKLDLDFAKAKATTGKPEPVDLGSAPVIDQPKHALPPSEIKAPTREQLMGRR